MNFLKLSCLLAVSLFLAQTSSAKEIVRLDDTIRCESPDGSGDVVVVIPPIQSSARVTYYAKGLVYGESTSTYKNDCTFEQDYQTNILHIVCAGARIDINPSTKMGTVGLLMREIYCPDVAVNPVIPDFSL